MIPVLLLEKMILIPPQGPYYLRRYQTTVVAGNSALMTTLNNQWRTHVLFRCRILLNLNSQLVNLL